MNPAPVEESLCTRTLIATWRRTCGRSYGLFLASPRTSDPSENK